MPVTGLSLAFSARARARALEPLPVTVPNKAVGAIAAATGGSDIRVSVIGALAPTLIGVSGEVFSVGARIRLPGNPRADRLFLDDPRNAPRLSGNIRDALTLRRPDLKDKLAANHKAWTRTFARNVMVWNKALEHSRVRGKRIADAHDRYALLNWAGAIIKPRSKKTGPGALANLPQEPDLSELAAYTRYIDALVAALV